jgi:type IV secretory pathway TraG/TraD family ATPase VirD4
MVQDKMQTANRIGLNKMKKVLANLSTKFFVKTNDSGTAQFFESYFEDIMVENHFLL